MNIVLTGMRGSGKSTVGRLLAEQLGFGFMETDAMVEKNIGCPITDFVREQGWETFRLKETDAVRDAVQSDRTVISTGGGAVLSQENVAKLKANGLMIFLYAPIEILVARLKKETAARPLLTDAATLEEDMARVWKEREPLYRSAADAIINTVQQDSQSVAVEILGILEEKNIV